MRSLFTLAALVATAFAQGIAIGGPLEGSSISPGSNITVEVDRPNTLTGSQEVAIVIGLLSCASRGTCDTFDVTEVIGSILYVGPYAPAYQPATPGIAWKPPYQNFSVQVPVGIPKGPASLTVSHFSLVGVSFRRR